MLPLCTTSIAQSPNQSSSQPSAAIAEPWYEIGGQTTVIGQELFPFHDPYNGPQSLPSVSEARWTNTYTLYLGLRATPYFDLYADPEDSLGSGLGNSTGIAAFPNEEVVRIGVEQIPYWARAFGRLTISTGHGGKTVGLEADENQIPGKRPADALIISGGKMSTVDFFDKNRYANSPRTQFMNWALVNCPAYDYAADTRGYSPGVELDWDHPTWDLRAGSFMMPAKANGPDLAGDLAYDRGDQVEGEYHPRILKKGDPAVVRLMEYRNIAHMGNYQDALNLAAATGTSPNIISVEKPAAQKIGTVLNFEQPLADDGDTGLFGRIGWNDGRTESYAYTECDQSFSLGLQVSGKKWRSPKDTWAIAVVDDGLSAPHREYLAEGGLGFLLGDGRLRYGQEQVLETYYARQINKYVQASLDYQFIANPGYNQDRGPVSVLSARLHLEF